MNEIKNDSDIVFQALSWDYYHEEDDEGDPILKYTIRIYGKKKDLKNVYVKVTNFTPYFYVEIPKHWRKQTVSMFINELKKRVYPDTPNIKDSLNVFTTRPSKSYVYVLKAFSSPSLPKYSV